MKFSLIRILFFALLMAITQVASADVPLQMSYQGRLTDGAGNSLDEIVAMKITIYSDSLGTTMLWSESHGTVTVVDGLFTIMLGSVTSIPASVFTGAPRWLGIQVDVDPELRPLRPLLSVPNTYQALHADTAQLAKTIADNSVTSSKIANNTISFSDIAQNGATSGQVMKWNGSAWVASTDATAANTSGWIDNGTSVDLIGLSDTVSLSTNSRLGKLNINGDLGMSGQSAIYFGSANARLEHLAGNDMKWVGADLSLLSTESVYFTEYGVATWAEFDNVNRRVGIGTINPDDRLHVENSDAGTCWLKIQGSHPTNWGQTGLRIQTPANTWHLRQDLYTHANFPEGALSLYSSAMSEEAMTWLENGNVGIGTANPTRKLHVDGSIQIDDTLYAGAIKPSLMAASRLPDEPGMAASKVWDVIGFLSLTHDWQTLTSRQIDVPAAGYVLAIGQAWTHYDHTYADYDGISFAVSEVPDDAPYETQAHFSTGYDVGSGSYSISLTPHGVFRVTAAGSYTYYLIGKKFDAVGTNVYSAELTLIYIPSAYGTVTTSKEGAGTAPATNLLETISRPLASEEPNELEQLRSELELLKKRLDQLEK